MVIYTSNKSSFPTPVTIKNTIKCVMLHTLKINRLPSSSLLVCLVNLRVAKVCSLLVQPSESSSMVLHQPVQLSPGPAGPAAGAWAGAGEGLVKRAAEPRRFHRG